MPDEVKGPHGFKLRRVREDGEVLEMEVSYSGRGPMPPEHFHPSQEERFEILEGRLATVIDGVERVYSEGETFTVPAGVRHQMTGDGRALTRWEVRPPLRTWEFFEQLYGGPVSENFLDDYRAEFRLTGSYAT